MFPTDSWSRPPKKLSLAANEIHVWRAGLSLKASYLHGLKQILSADEQARAERFYFRKDREHFIAARGLLRVILGRYLNMEPSRLRFRYNPYGKPDFAGESGKNGLRFNLAHSQELVLFAITRGREIGIDLEYIRGDLADSQVAERYFSPREVEALRALPKDLQPLGFFNCWTRKEAYVKARGEGLTVPLDKFEVSLAPGEPPALLHVENQPQECSRWSLEKLIPDPGYAAALVVEGHHWNLSCWQWPDEFDWAISL